MIVCALSIALNKSDAIALFFKPFPHSVSFDFQNSMLSIFHIHSSIGGHSAMLVSGTMSTPVTSSLNRIVHQPDKTTLARDDCPSAFVVVSFFFVLKFKFGNILKKVSVTYCEFFYAEYQVINDILNHLLVRTLVANRKMDQVFMGSS